MFGSLRDDVIAAVTIRFRHSLNGKVIRFGGAAGENDLIRLRTDQ